MPAIEEEPWTCRLGALESPGRASSVAAVPAAKVGTNTIPIVFAEQIATRDRPC